MKSKAFLFVFCINIINIFAEPVIPKCFNVIQNNEDTIEVYLKGDEYGSWYETRNGDIIDIDLNTLNFYYVKPVADTLALSNIMVNNNNVSLFDKTLMMEIIENRRSFIYNKLHPSHVDFDSTDQETIAYIQNLTFNDSIHQQRVKKRIEPTNSKKILTILMEFQDIKFEHPLSIKNLVDSLINGEYYSFPNSTGTYPSVNSYYKSASYNKLDIKADVVGPYTANHNRKFYGAKTWFSDDVIAKRLVYEAICKAANEVDFSDYDNDGDGYVECIHVLFAGQGQNEDGAPNEAIWPHQGSMGIICRDGVCISRYVVTPEKYHNNYRGIGTICHELGHIFGAPDFYDTKNDTFPGTSTWDLMGGGNWNGYPQTTYPAHPNPYIKKEIFGWINTIDELSGNNSLYTLRPAELDSNSIYKLSTSTPGEYYLLENRQDPDLWGTGLLVYHVHKNIKNGFLLNNVNVKHPQKMYVVDANNHIEKSAMSTPESYGNINSAYATFRDTLSKNMYFTSESLPSNCAWNGTPTQNKDVCFISEELVNGEMCVKFVLNPEIDGPDVLCDSAIYSLKHVPSATIEWTYTRPSGIPLTSVPLYIGSGQGTKAVYYKRGIKMTGSTIPPGLDIPVLPVSTTNALNTAPYSGFVTISAKVTLNGNTFTLSKEIYMPEKVVINDVNLGSLGVWYVGAMQSITLQTPTDDAILEKIRWDIKHPNGNTQTAYGSSVVVRPDSKGTLTVTATYLDGCGDEYEFYTKTFSIVSAFNLTFANPASGSVEINVTSGDVPDESGMQTMSVDNQQTPYMGAYRVELWHDIYGKVREMDVSENNPTITMNLEGLNSGVYVLRLIIDNQVEKTSQLIVK